MKQILNNIMSANLIVFLIVIQGCSPTDKNTSKNFISPPFESAKINFIEKELNANEEAVIRFSNGSMIQVPANAFVNKNNKPIHGKVTLKYREFNDAADIIMSGIPMTYDSAGIRYNFQTAGMFDIRGFQNNEPIFIAKNKKINIHIASNASDANYNFYQLDTTRHNWTNQGKPTVTTNQAKLDKLNIALGVPVEQPVEPTEYDPDKFVFDLKVNTNAYPELSDFKDIIWQYAGSSDSIDPEKNNWIFQENWTNIELKDKNTESNLFWLSLTNHSKKFNTLIKPVFAGKQLAEAKKNFKKRKREYEAYLDRRNDELKRLQNEGDFLRSLAVSNFGIFNYDRCYHIPDAVPIVADFEFDQDVNKEQVTVYLITGDSRVVVPYPNYQWKLFSYVPSEKNSLVAIMPGDKMAVYKDFDKLHFTKGNSPNVYKFKLKTVNKKIQSPNDIRDVLENI